MTGAHVTGGLGSQGAEPWDKAEEEEGPGTGVRTLATTGPFKALMRAVL